MNKLAILLLFVSFSSNTKASPEPEAGGVVYQKENITAQQYMVVTAHPEATNAAFSILQNGGSAVDAAIAAQMMLTLVEPQASGIGGGGFLLHWDKKASKLQGYDGRETAPAKATPQLFVEKGTPIKFWQGVVGGRAVGVPGVVRMLKMAHEKHGKLEWSTLIKPAIKKSRQGFKVSHRLNRQLTLARNPGLRTNATATRAYFYPNGKPLPQGYNRKNPQLAKSLEIIARTKGEGIYSGELAQAIVSAVTEHKSNPGLLSLNDLKSYRPIRRNPICTPYRSFRICGMPPPAGGSTVLQLLGIINQHPTPKGTPTSESSVHLFTQASRLAYADRGRFVADPDFVSIPLKKLLSPNYLSGRAKLITPMDMGKAQPGLPKEAEKKQDGKTFTQPSTSHLSIVDGDGNAVAMTTSIEMGFGSTLMAGGFLLNNQLTDFSFNPDKNGKPIANRVSPKKRPRSSMSPIMVFDNSNNLKLVIGSPGGSRIITYVAQTIIAHLDFGLPIQEAITLPRLSNRNDITVLEAGTTVTKLKNQLERRNHKVKIADLNSGLHAIAIDKSGTLASGVDPRREGSAKGF